MILLHAENIARQKESLNLEIKSDFALFPGPFRGLSSPAEHPTDTGRQREPGFHHPWQA